MELHRLPGRRARTFGEYYYIFTVLKGFRGLLDHRMSRGVAHIAGRAVTGQRVITVMKQRALDDARSAA